MGAVTSTPERVRAPSAVLRTLERWGGLLIRPRSTAARLDPGEGHHDAWALGILYLLGSEVYGLMEAMAGVVAMKNLGGLMMLGAQLGRALIAPILAIVAAETLLGSARAHRRAVALLPLVVLGAAAHALRQQGVALPGPGWTTELVAGLLGLALVWWIRDAVPEREEASS